MTENPTQESCRGRLPVHWLWHGELLVWRDKVIRLAELQNGREENRDQREGTARPPAAASPLEWFIGFGLAEFARKSRRLDCGW